MMKRKDGSQTMAPRKKQVPVEEQAASLAVANTWYFLDDVTSPPPPKDTWCLLHTIDVEGESTMYVAVFHGVLNIWLATGNVAIEAEEKAIAYSPVFDSSGKLWKSVV